jgi:hypothetical protein
MGNPGRQASRVGEVSEKIRPALLEQRRCPGLERIFLRLRVGGYFVQVFGRDAGTGSRRQPPDSGPVRFPIGRARSRRGKVRLAVGSARDVGVFDILPMCTGLRRKHGRDSNECGHSHPETKPVGFLHSLTSLRRLSRWRSISASPQTDQPPVEGLTSFIWHGHSCLLGKRA